MLAPNHQFLTAWLSKLTTVVIDVTPISLPNRILLRVGSSTQSSITLQKTYIEWKVVKSGDRTRVSDFYWRLVNDGLQLINKLYDFNDPYISSSVMQKWSFEEQINKTILYGKFENIEEFINYLIPSKMQTNDCDRPK